MASDSCIDRRCDCDLCAGKRSYLVEARCTNCKWEGTMRVLLGDEAWRVAIGAQCPRCECRSIKAGAYVDAA